MAIVYGQSHSGTIRLVIIAERGRGRVREQVMFGVVYAAGQDPEDVRRAPDLDGRAYDGKLV